MTRSVLVTGASGGLGLAASTSLAKAGWHVILGVRSPERGEAAAAAISREYPAARAEVLELDLASLGSVRAAAEALGIDGDRPPLHAVVANAGVQVVDGVQRTADGFELTFGTNHLGHFHLLNLLRDQLATPARIVVIASGTHQGPPRSGGFPAPRWADPQVLADPDAADYLDDSPKSGRIRYATSKLANIYATYEMARRFAGRGITVNAFDPGLMPSTRLARDYPERAQRIYRRLTPLLERLPLARTPERSGADIAWLVTAPEVAGVSGAHFNDRRQTRTSKASYDRQRAARLWQFSEELVSFEARSR